MSMHYDSESLVDRGRSPQLFALLVYFLNSRKKIMNNYCILQYAYIQSVTKETQNF